MVLVGTGGVQHEVLVKAAEQFLGNERTGSKEPPSSSRYVGGDVRIAYEGDTHIAIAFKGVVSQTRTYLHLEYCRRC